MRSMEESEQGVSESYICWECKNPIRLEVNNGMQIKRVIIENGYRMGKICSDCQIKKTSIKGFA